METRLKTKMLETLKIVPIQEEKRKKSKRKKLHPNLPDVYDSQLIGIISPLRGGKDTMISNLMLKEGMYNDLFPEDSVHVISNTIKTDATSRFLYAKYKDNCHERYSDQIIKNIVKKQQQKMDDPECKNTGFALIMNDIHGEFPKNSSAKRGMEAINFSTRFRHSSRYHDPCLVLYSTQRYYDLSPVLRNNCTSIMFGGNIKNLKEWELIKNDFSDAFGGIRKFEEMIKEVQEKPYQWLFLKLDKGEAYLNFEKRLF
jgi:hypothetical protein